MQRLSGTHGVGPVCRELDIAPSTYYWHQQRRLHPEKCSQREKCDAQISQEIKRVYEENTRSPSSATMPSRPFVGPDPFCELAYPTKFAARQAIADELRLPLAKLKTEDQTFIGQLLDAGRKGGIG
ncbi:hypothetical protein D3C71_1359810 [compost metagenome]